MIFLTSSLSFYHLKKVVDVHMFLKKVNPPPFQVRWISETKKKCDYFLKINLFDRSIWIFLYYADIGDFHEDGRSLVKEKNQCWSM